MKRIAIASTIVLALSSVLYLSAQQPAPPPPQTPPAAPPGGRRGGGPPGGGPETGMNTRPPNGEGQKPAFAGQTRAPEQTLGVAFDAVTVTEGLVNPWGLTFLPDGRMLVTEKPGRLRIVSADGKQMSEPVTGLPAVDARGQGGLLDVALDPGVREKPADLLELRRAAATASTTARSPAADSWTVPRLRSRTCRSSFIRRPRSAPRCTTADAWSSTATARLFVTLGERSITEGRMQAQRLDGLLGKIVRLNTDGSVPKDNPFVGKPDVRPEIWSFGHRNVQAAALDPATGELWEVEHGTRGGDELNVVRKGRDYGWPTIAYGIEYQGKPITGGIQQQEGMEQPRYYWDPVIAPSGMVFYTGKLFPAWRNSLFIGGHGQHQPRAPHPEG